MTSTHGPLRIDWGTGENAAREIAVHRGKRRITKGMVLDYWYGGTTTHVSVWTTKGTSTTTNSKVMALVAGIATTETEPYVDITTKTMVARVGIRQVLATGTITVGKIMRKSATWPGVARCEAGDPGDYQGFAFADESVTLTHRRLVRAIVLPWRI